MWLVLLVVVVATVYGDDYEGYNDNQCRPCPYFAHPEVVYCASDIVARIKVNWNVTNPVENTETYGITVKHIEKLGEGVNVNKEDLIIMEEQCYSFSTKHPGDKSGKTYLVMGSIWMNEKGYPQIILTQCSYSIAVNDMNCYQRKGVFKLTYKSNCACVNVDKKANSVKFRCPDLEKDSSCYRDYAYCKNNGDHCGWREFWKFRDCT